MFLNPVKSDGQCDLFPIKIETEIVCPKSRPKVCKFQDRCLAVVDLDKKSEENVGFLDFYETYFIPRNSLGKLKNYKKLEFYPNIWKVILNCRDFGT